jgi:hypothetical protein
VALGADRLPRRAKDPTTPRPPVCALVVVAERGRRSSGARAGGRASNSADRSQRQCRSENGRSHVQQPSCWRSRSSETDEACRFRREKQERRRRRARRLPFVAEVALLLLHRCRSGAGSDRVPARPRRAPGRSQSRRASARCCLWGSGRSLRRGSHGTKDHQSCLDSVVTRTAGLERDGLLGLNADGTAALTDQVYMCSIDHGLCGGLR